MNTLNIDNPLLDVDIQRLSLKNPKEAEQKSTSMMIQLVSPPQALVQLVIPHLLCFSVFDDGNTSKQLEDWVEEINKLYHIQDLTKPTDPISNLLTQINYITALNQELEGGNQKQLKNVTDNNQQLRKQLLKLENNNNNINSKLEQEVNEVIKKLPPETAELIIEDVTLYLDYNGCQSAVKNGHKETKNLIEHGKDLQQKLKDAEKEAEHLQNQLNHISALLKPEERDKQLLSATKEGNVTLVKELLELGANISTRNELGSTPLIHAAETGNMEIAELLLDSGAGLEDVDELGNTPLLWATLNGHFNICKLLLDRGANVNAKGSSNSSALHLAAFYGDLQIAKLLVERGADVNAVDENGRTPREDAITNDKLDVENFLSKHKT